MTVLPSWSHGSGCLGDRVADLADGRLAPADAETAFAHVAVCDRCRVALDSARAATAALSSPAPEPSSDLLDRLRGIPVAEAERERAAREWAVPSVPAQASGRPSGAAGVRPATPTGPSRPAATRRRRVRVAVGSAAGAAALAVAAVVGGAPAAVGGPPPSAPTFAPVVDALADEHSATTRRMPFSGPLVITAAYDQGSGSSYRP